MKKTLLSVAAIGLMFSSAQASVVLNETNFPDENLRNYASQYDEDGNGTLSDAELAAITDINAGGILNLKGAEHFKNLGELHLWGYSEEECIREIDPSMFPKLYRFSLGDCWGVTSLDFSQNALLQDLNLSYCSNVSSLTLPTSIEVLSITGLPKLTSLDVSKLTKLNGFYLNYSGITDLDFSNNPALSGFSISGEEDNKQVLNSLNLQNCNALENFQIQHSTIGTLTMKHLPLVRSLLMTYNDITTMTIEDCAEFNWLSCQENLLRTLWVKDCPLLESIQCEDNQLQVLIADNCPHIGQVEAANNRLMWLDLKDVVKGNVDESTLKLDNQQPSVQAVKLSPAEVGLRVHERLDVNRVLNLRAKGIAQTPKEVTVDGIRYFVFYDNGPDTPNLVGSDCGYEYDTKWPYPWMEGNTKDNRLPVTLNVTSWTKHPSWIRIDGETTITTEVGNIVSTPTIIRSQDYDGQLTWKSSNEDVVRVNAGTGELSIVGPGTATITISGEETDYRLAPASVTLMVTVSSPTAIDHHATTLHQQPSPSYDLQGRKVDWQAARKGVYIVGGKKVTKK